MTQQKDVIGQFSQMEYIIDSMTPKERANPDILNGSRKRRITMGSGTTIQDLNRLLKQHKQMGKMMKKMKGKNMRDMARGMMSPNGAEPLDPMNLPKF
jgi:signal recognition particle subunit SRP54